jgi:hypothetical protein
MAAIPPPSDLKTGVCKFQLAHLLATETIFGAQQMLGVPPGPPKYEVS